MKLIILLIIFTISTFAQQFTVKNVVGKVKILRGTSENWENIHVGEQLLGSDLLLTENNSSILLKNDNGSFLINDNLAVGLKNIKSISLNDLILALAMEEIRNVPKNKDNGQSKNTAVYGSEVKPNTVSKIKDEKLGFLKLKGAKYLNKKGFTESAIIVAKEVFRNYPSISRNFNDRIYFADLLYGLKLYQEAATEYSQIQKLDISDLQKLTIEKKKEAVSIEIINNK